jgi:nucleotide-binding universal stress UspA family protein
VAEGQLARFQSLERSHDLIPIAENAPQGFVSRRWPTACFDVHVPIEKGAPMPRSLFRHILVPHDFSPQATVALRAAAELAKQNGGKLTVLHILVPFYLPADTPFGMTPPGDLIAEQRGHLERLVTKTLGNDRLPATVRVEIGDASQRIIDAGRRADSIVMATSGRTGLAHFLIGSVAEKVVRHATVPVLTLRVATRKRSRRRRRPRAAQ